MKMKRIVAVVTSLLLIFSLANAFALTTGDHENEEWRYMENDKFEWIQDLEVDDSDPTLEITAELENVGEEPDNLNLVIDGDRIRQWEVYPGESIVVNETHEIEERGSYWVELHDQRVEGDMHPDPELKEFSVNGERDSVETRVEDPIEIYYELENDGNFPHYRDIIVGDKEAEETLQNWTVKVEPGETVEWEQEYKFEETGEYNVSLKDWARQTIDVDVKEEIAEFEVHDFAVETDDLEATITGTVVNIGGAEGTIYLLIDDNRTWRETLESGEEVWLDYTHEFEEEGSYTIELADESKTVYVEEVPEPEFEVNHLGVGVDGMVVIIEAEVENIGEADGELEVLADGEVIATIFVEAGETEYVSETHEFDEEGRYTIEVGDESETVYVEDETEKVTLEIIFSAHGEVVEPGFGTHFYSEGEEVELVVVPHERYEFEEWTGDIENIEDPESTQTWINMEDDYEIVPKFSEIEYEYELRIEPSFGGTIVEPEDTYMFFEEEQTIDLKAEAQENYEFNRWIGDTETVHDPYSEETQLDIEDDVYLVAEFVPEHPELTVLVEGSGSVFLEDQEIDVHYQEFYEEGTEVALTAEAADGYEFYSWTGDVYEEDKELETTVDENQVVRALFIPEDIDEDELVQQPEWEVGDSWAMGFEDDLDDLFMPILEELEDEIEDDDELEEIAEIKDIRFDLDGEVGFYDVSEVVEANDDGYIVEVESGGGIEVEGSVTVEAEMPEEGEYDPDEDPDEIPTEVRNITLTGEIDYTLDISGTVEYDEKMAVESTHLVIENELSVSLGIENAPFSEDFLEEIWETDEEDLPENQSIVIEYTDYEFTVSADTVVTMDIDFDPALDFFNFPIYEGKEWITPTTIDMSGDYHGEIDVTGVPEFIKEDFEEEFDIDFPILLEDIETEIPFIRDGDIEIPQVPLEPEMGAMPLQCTGTDTIVLHDGTTREVHAIELGHGSAGETLGGLQSTGNEPHFKMLFAEEEGFLVEHDIYLGEEMEEFGLGDMTMRSMEPEEARNSMKEMQDEDPDEEPEEHELNVNIDGQGIVEVNDEEIEDGWTEEFDRGSTVTLEAEPEEDWYFDEWRGDYTSELREIELELDEDKYVTANFAQVGEDQVVLTVEIEGEGKTDPVGDTVYDIGETATVVVPEEYEDEFVEWTGDISEDEAGELEITVEMDEDKTVTAVFEEEEEEDDDEELSGFTIGLLLIAVITVIVLSGAIKTKSDDES